MEVVLLGPLQQLLEPEQLHLKLPNYVPPAVQTSIVRAFQAQTVDQVMHLPSADQSLVPKPKRMRLWIEIADTCMWPVIIINHIIIAIYKSASYLTWWIIDAAFRNLIMHVGKYIDLGW